MTSISRPLLAVALGLWLALAPGPPARAASEQEELIEKARLVVEKLTRNEDIGSAVRAMLRDAKGVLVVPALLKGAFFFGAEGGSGVLLAKGRSGAWSYPAFYTLGSASFGLQFGGQSAEVMLIIMTDRGLNSVVSHKVKIGGDVSGAIGPYGVGAEAATTANLGADILAYSVTKGAFVGFSIEGAVIFPREDWTTEYYGDPGATPRAVVLEGRYRNRQADRLRETLAAVR